MVFLLDIYGNKYTTYSETTSFYAHTKEKYQKSSVREEGNFSSFDAEIHVE